MSDPIPDDDLDDVWEANNPPPGSGLPGTPENPYPPPPMAPDPDVPTPQDDP